jgi:hypothetical protein
VLTSLVRRDSYIALGDSFAASIATRRPGWTDSVARRFRHANPRLDYKNLARAGASSTDVISQQLPRAYALEPDVVTLACGLDELLGGDSVVDLVALTCVS